MLRDNLQDFAAAIKQRFDALPAQTQIIADQAAAQAANDAVQNAGYIDQGQAQTLIAAAAANLLSPAQAQVLIDAALSGIGPMAPTYGDAFPTDPVPGQLFTRTDLDETTFFWDSRHQLWLGERKRVDFGDTSLSTNEYLTAVARVKTSSTAGIYLGRRHMVETIRGSWRSEIRASVDESRRQLRLIASGATLTSFALEGKTIDVSTNHMISEGRLLALRNGSTSLRSALFTVTVREVAF